MRKSIVSTVVIDPGHGGHDSGCLGPNRVKEKDVALSIALKFGKFIEENFPEVKVVYTRKTDVFIELHQRAEIANEAKADLFVSVHCNSACYYDKKRRKEQCNVETHGTETWVMGLHKTEANLEVSKRENSVVLMEKDYLKQYEGFDPNSPEADIIFSLYQNTYMDQSLRLATLVQQELTGKGRQNRGVKQAGFWVLYKTAMPSILIETGFLSNPAEEKYLGSAKGQQEVASGIYRAFRQYKSAMEPAPDRTEKTPSPVKEETEPVTVTVSEKTEQPSVEKADTVTSGSPEKSAGQGAEQEVKIHFSVQIISSVQKLPKGSPRFKGLKDIQEEKKDNVYKYSYGNFSSFDESVSAQTKMREMGFKDAFVVAYKNGTRITVPEARETLKKINSK